MPDHHDAELVIKLYELRREATMRQARSAMHSKFWPKSFDDVAAVWKPDHPLNTAYRQTSTYWEMVYGMAKHEIIDPEFLLESCGEGLSLFARIEPYLEQIRQSDSPRAFQNAEWVATHSELGRQMLARLRARVEQTLAAR
jgi:hypothetical protein